MDALRRDAGGAQAVKERGMKLNRDEILDGLALLLVAGIAALLLAAPLWYFNPFVRLPPIGRHLPSGPQAEEVFDARVQAQWPLPIDEDRMVAELEAQGFTVSKRGPSGMRTANFEKRYGLCGQEWSIRWTRTDGEIDRIFGVYGLTCF